MNWTVQGQAAVIGLTIQLTDALVGQPDAPTIARSQRDPTAVLNVTWTAPDNTGQVVITAYQVQYRKKGDTDWSAYAGELSAAANSHSLSGLEVSTAYEVRVRAVGRNEGAGPWSPSGEGATDSQNSRPEFSRQATTRTVSENAPAGTPVGQPVTAIDREGHPLAYTLLTPSQQFELNAVTGQLTVAEGASLDHEARDSYTVIVEASDGLSILGTEDHIVDAQTTVTIEIADVSEAPPKLDAPTVRRSSVSPTSDLVVTWTEPDMTGKPQVTAYALRYKKAGESDWTDYGSTGLQSRVTISGLSEGTAYQFSVRATNDEGSGPWSNPGLGSTADQHFDWAQARGPD